MSLLEWIDGVLPLWLCFTLLALLMVFIFIYLMRPDGVILWLPDENIYIDPNNNNKIHKFPSPSTSPSVYISIVIPAFDEQERLPKMIEDTLNYLKNRKVKESSFTYEVVIVDDGSRDNTSNIALKYVKKETVNNVRLLKLLKNRGKGGAVKRGVLCARGKYVLMADADGATDITDLNRLEENIRKIEKSDGFAVSVGSRAHLVNSDVVAKRTFIRNILMHGFHLFVYILGVKGIKDTQCGFKLFSYSAARTLFDELHIERWAFDVELLYRAQLLNIPVAEVAVNWREIPGSKLSPIASSIQMAKDLARIRLAYILRIWKTPKLKSD